jgi:hypothetical protein
MNYELWDIDAHFFLGRFSSEEEALHFVRRVLDEEGDAYADNLELAIGDDGTKNLSGCELVERTRSLGVLY